MKFIIPIIIFMIPLISQADQNKSVVIESKETVEVITTISHLINKHYVSTDIGNKISTQLKNNLKNGKYKQTVNPYDLANQLTADIKSINGDKHLKVSYTAKMQTTKTNDKPKNNAIDSKGKWTNYGYQEIKILDGNIGYLKINHFSNWNHFEKAKKTVDAVFNTFNGIDALIIDVNDNSGGFEEIVAYVISYLFTGPSIHLSDYYVRYDNSTSSTWTSVDIPAKKQPNIPVYVLVNGNTASAAESLAYMLKHQKRATIIGKTTAGAGHGAMTHNVNDRFKVTISSEETINAVTKTSFEGIGVKPDIEIDSEKSFIQAYLLALEYLKHKNPDQIDQSNYNKLIEFLPVNTDAVIDFTPYVGKYKSEAVEIHIFIKENQLYATAVGKGSFKLEPTKNHVFIIGNIKQRIQFIFNDKNKVVKLLGIDSPMDLNKYE